MSLILCLTSSFEEGSILFGLLKRGLIEYINAPLTICKRGVFYFFSGMIPEDGRIGADFASPLIISCITKKRGCLFNDDAME